jgi:hypothetical protein
MRATAAQRMIRFSFHWQAKKMLLPSHLSLYASCL